MKFGSVVLAQAEGAVLAHSQVLEGGVRLRKGVTLGKAEIAALRNAGLQEVTIAQLGADDLGEDAAATRIAQAHIRDAGPCGLRVAAAFTGRVNVFAALPGVLRVDVAAINRINAIDPAITVACLPDYTRVTAGDMLATIKIIPYGVAGSAVDSACNLASGTLLQVHPRQCETAALILTQTPGMAEKLLAKGQRAVEGRLQGLGVRLGSVEVVAHREEAVAAALVRARDDLILVLGASATSDVGDVVPAALVAAGGKLIRFGMPVDPGNLMVLGRLKGRAVIGMPGCARSPALNGADWVLERIICGLEVSADDIAAMGVGGLLMEIPTRPQPRAYARPKDGKAPLRVEAILLAAGSARRMGGKDKLLEGIGDEALIHRSARAILASDVASVHVVLPAGNQPRLEALAGLNVDIVATDDAAEGMAASLRAGLAVVSPAADGVLIALADMPDVGVEHVNRLLAEFDPEAGAEIIRATTPDHRPGHPVLFGRRFFENLSALRGDQGAKAVIAAAGEFLRDVAMPDQGPATDLDTPEAFEAYRAKR